MGQLTEQQFKEFHQEYQNIEKVIKDSKRQLKQKYSDRTLHGDYEFFQMLYSKGYKLVKV